MSNNDDIQHKLVELKDNYLASLPEKLKQLENHWNDLLANPDNNEQQQTTVRAFHTLAGSGASFGFPDITELSREIENTLKNSLKQNQTIDDTTRIKVELILQKLLELDLNDERRMTGSARFVENGTPAEHYDKYLKSCEEVNHPGFSGGCFI